MLQFKLIYLSPLNVGWNISTIKWGKSLIVTKWTEMFLSIAKWDFTHNIRVFFSCLSNVKKLYAYHQLGSWNPCPKLLLNTLFLTHFTYIDCHCYHNFQDIDDLYKEAIREHGSVLVQVALPPAGPPVVINIGKFGFGYSLFWFTIYIEKYKKAISKVLIKINDTFDIWHFNYCMPLTLTKKIE